MTWPFVICAKSAESRTAAPVARHKADWNSEEIRGVASPNGFVASTATANSRLLRRPHQMAGLIKSNGFLPGRYTAAIGCVGVGCAAAGHTPMIAVKVIGRHFQHDDFRQSGGHRRQESSHRRELRDLPYEVRTNIEWLDPAVAFQERSSKIALSNPPPSRRPTVELDGMYMGTMPLCWGRDLVEHIPCPLDSRSGAPWYLSLAEL